MSAREPVPPHEYGKVIEEQIDLYEEQQYGRLLAPGDVSNEELRDIRGRAQGARDLRRILRSHLMYRP